MIKDILRMGDPRLLRISRPVDRFDAPELHRLVDDLFDTMRAADGAGLAAPQIGVDLRVVIFGFAANAQRRTGEDPIPETVLVNPVLEAIDDVEESDWEGCLSVPGLRGVVPRRRSLRYRGFDADGRAIDRVVHGYHARVVQHECDHLDGVLYPMRMRDFRTFGFTSELFPGAPPGDD